MTHRAQSSLPGAGLQTVALDPRARAGIAGAALVMALPLLMNGFYKEWLFSFGELFFWMADCLQVVAIPAACLVYLYLRVNIRPADYGLARPRDSDEWWRLISTTLGTTVVLYFTYNVVSQVAWMVSTAPPPEFTYHITVPEGAMGIPVVFYFALTAGVTEEIAFRGLPWTALRTLPLVRAAGTTSRSILAPSIPDGAENERQQPENDLVHHGNEVGDDEIDEEEQRHEGEELGEFQSSRAFRDRCFNAGLRRAGHKTNLLSQWAHAPTLG
jgi:membrane protease YdiL (CAAX protease family)